MVSIRRFLLQSCFLTLFEINGFLFSQVVRLRFLTNFYWSKQRVGVVVPSEYLAALYNVFSYLGELCTLHSRLIILGYMAVDMDVFFRHQLQTLWTNFFINGMEARFAHFLNWNTVFLTDQGRSPNRRRFQTSLWWVHYQARLPLTLENRDIGGVILHKYFFRQLLGQPRIFLDPARPEREFFLPLPVRATQFWLFSFVYMLVRLFFYYRVRNLATRFFWESRFRIRRNRMSLDIPIRTLEFAFTLHGRRFSKMQLWEYMTFFDAFTHLPPLVQAINAAEYKYDPKF